MQYKILILLSIFISGNCNAALYSLDKSSLYSSITGDTQLSGTFSLNLSMFSLLGQAPVGNLSYAITSVNLQVNDSLITLNGFDYQYIPGMLSPWSVLSNDNIKLNSEGVINGISAVYLGITQSGSGNNYYQYKEEFLKPVFVSNSTFNNVVLGSNYYPSSLLLTYELHEVV
ncbi:MAG: hypothetical protein WCP96_16085 [Methylococcaceae bacterium]